MTERDKRQQRADLIIEIEDASRDVAQHRELLLRHADSLDDITRWLRSEAAHKAAPPDEALVSNIKADSRYRSSTDFDGLLRYTEELRSHRQKLANLESRKGQLDAPSGSLSVTSHA